MGTFICKHCGIRSHDLGPWCQHCKTRQHPVIFDSIFLAIMLVFCLACYVAICVGIVMLYEWYFGDESHLNVRWAVLLAWVFGIALICREVFRKNRRG